jgi:hypothetical protein
VDSQQEKPDEGEPNMDDGGRSLALDYKMKLNAKPSILFCHPGPCDSAEDNQDVSSAANFKADEMQAETQVSFIYSSRTQRIDSISIYETLRSTVQRLGL